MRVLTDAERIARAYATLGLPRDATAQESLRQYRRLARRWHPDRYAQDPQGQADAAQQMRQINAAFALVRPLLREAVDRPAAAAPIRPASAPPDPPLAGGRLRPEEIDAIVESMRRPPPLGSVWASAARIGLYVGGLALVALSGGKALPLVLGALLIVSAVGRVVAGDRWRGRRAPRTGWTAWYNR